MTQELQALQGRLNEYMTHLQAAITDERSSIHTLATAKQDYHAAQYRLQAAQAELRLEDVPGRNQAERDAWLASQTTSLADEVQAAHLFLLEAQGNLDSATLARRFLFKRVDATMHQIAMLSNMPLNWQEEREEVLG